MTQQKQRASPIHFSKAKYKQTDNTGFQHLIRSLARQLLTLSYRVYAELFLLRSLTRHFVSPAKCVEPKTGQSKQLYQVELLKSQLTLGDK